MENKQPPWGGVPGGSLTVSLYTCTYTLKLEASSRPRTGWQPHHLRDQMHPYIHNERTGSLPWAACLGHPSHVCVPVPIYMKCGRHAAGPGRAAKGNPTNSLYMRRHTYEMRSNQLAWSGLPGATLPCLYVHRDCEGKQSAWGRLPKQSPSYLHTCADIQNGI